MSRFHFYVNIKDFLLLLFLLVGSSLMKFKALAPINRQVAFFQQFVKYTRIHYSMIGVDKFSVNMNFHGLRQFDVVALMSS